MIGVALGLVAALTTGSACRLATVVFVGTVATTILLAADIAFQGHAVLASLGGSRLLKLAGIVAAFAITFELVWLLRGGMSRTCSSEPSRYLPRLWLNTRRFCLGALPRLTPLSTPQSQAPPVIYIIFDELIGPEGMNRNSGGEATTNAMLDVFLKHGFRLYGNAYSRHSVTAKSIPATLNFDEHDRSYGVKSKYYLPGDKEVIGTNALFALMKDEGRNLTVYQTSHLDFCSSSAAVDRCRTFPSFNPLNPYAPELQQARNSIFDILRRAYNESYFVTRYMEWQCSRRYLNAESTAF